ncbi:MAG TPA: hypothetical protein VLU95_00700 [Candidatus Acidoferrum sp.]|nr:hypothetical protein [Candidatus Acidoferrum sp.]
MGSLKNLGQGFLVATALIWIFNIASLFINGDAWIALLYLLILLIPLTSLTYLKLKNPKTQASYEDPSLHLCLSVYPSKWRKLLFSFQGVALAFWMFDLATTFYAINVTGLAVELNPLGWPLGILGALSYYAPTLVFSYILLFKIKDKISLYAAIPLTLMTLAMSAMNLMAGAQNFQVFVDTATLTTGVRSGLMAVIGTVSLTMPFALKRKVNQPKAVLP